MRDRAAKGQDLPGALRVVSSVAVRADLDPFLDLRGLACYSSLSRRTLQDLVNDQDDPIPSYRIGGKILVRRSEFDQWMTRRRNRKPLDAARLAAADAQALLAARPPTMSRPPVDKPSPDGVEYAIPSEGRWDEPARGACGGLVRRPVGQRREKGGT